MSPDPSVKDTYTRVFYKLDQCQLRANKASCCFTEFLIILKGYRLTVHVPSPREKRLGGARGLETFRVIVGITYLPKWTGYLLYSWTGS